jgi:dethiobiotin synthetase
LSVNFPGRIVVVGTGTGIGKTHVACAVLRAFGEKGVPAIGLKPIETGIPDSSNGGETETDQGRLAVAANAFHVKRSGSAGFHVKRPLYAFPNPVSPHLAARTAGRRLDLGAIGRWVGEHEAPVVLIESAGGLFSPLGPEISNVDLVKALSPALVLLVAPDRLGVLHDLTATLGLAAARGCTIHAVVLSAPHSVDASTGTNAVELERLGVVRPAALFPRADESDPASLDAASKTIQALEGA